MLTTRTQLVCLLLLVGACEGAPQPTVEVKAISPAPSSAPVAVAPPPAAPAPAKSPLPPVPAEIGKPAPVFTLSDLDGKPVSLGDFQGKLVVLEWFNPGCPFVRAAHTKGSLVDAAKRARKAGVVWLAINSGAPGQQGHGAEASRNGVTSFGLDHPVLLDEDGRVGRSYGAERTPHLFVIDAQGLLAYAGAVDNSPDGEGEAAEGGKLVRYVDQALAELAAKRAVSVPSTKPYGCSVKYGKS